MNSFSSPSSSHNSRETVTSFFENLEKELEAAVPSHYFDRPRRFRSLLEVIDVLGSKIESAESAQVDERDAVSQLEKQNPAYNTLVEQREFICEKIEDIVKFQHGSLNHCVETMGDVLGAYTKSKDDVTILRQSIGEIKQVLLSKKDGQTDIKNLWLRKMELEESIRILNGIESLKDAPMQVQLHTQHNRYLAAVNTLNASVKMMFEVDYVQIEALSVVREQLMNQKEILLEVIADKLKAVVVGANTELWSIHNSSKPKQPRRRRAGSCVGSTLGSALGSPGPRVGSVLGGGSIDDDLSMLESEMGYSEIGRSVFNGVTAASSELGGSTTGNSETHTLGSSIRPNFGGGTSRRTARHISSSAFFWSTDMSEATEAKESSLHDPQASGSLFIRLLVKSVSCLQCEDDMERMIFEGTHELFRGGLLRIKRQRMEEAEELRRNANSINQEDDVYRQHVNIFTSFVQDVLNSAYLMLKMVFYVLKLIDRCKRDRYAQAGIDLHTQHSDFELKESARKEVLVLWSATENIIMTELSRHFVEKDVEDMEDDVNNLDDDDDDCQSPKLNRRSSGNFFGLNFQQTELGEIEDLLTVCPPSCRLAAPVYKDIMSFSAKVKALFREEIDDHITVDSIIEKSVVRTLDSTLMPLIQSEVNAEMQELQTDSSLFTSRSVHTGLSRANTEAFVEEHGKICEAALRCARVINPLFYHWYELPQHQDMVLTILDRVVRSFISSAKEEMEALSWQFVSAEKHHQIAILGGLKADPLLAVYRHNVFEGKNSIDDLLDSDSVATNNSAAYLSPNRVHSIKLTRSEDSHFAMDNEFGTWGDIWDIQNSNTALGEKVVTDFAKLKTLASISYGCDWLTKIICTMCSQTMIRSVPSRNRRHKLMEANAASDPVQVLRSTIESIANSLQKLSEICMCLIRGEVEVACLHYLRQLILLHVRGSAQLSEKEQARASAANNAKGVNVLQEGDHNIVTVFNHHLISCQDVVLTGANPGLLSVVLSPLCKIIPMFFTKSLVYHIPTDFFSIANVDRLLKAIVACQQNFSILLESSTFDPAVSRRLQDSLSDEFDRVRSLMNLINMNPRDFKDYVRSHRHEFTKDEYEFVWKFLRHRNLTARLPVFSEFWKEIASPTENSSIMEEDEQLPTSPPSLQRNTGRRGSVKSRRSSNF